MKDWVKLQRDLYRQVRQDVTRALTKRSVALQRYEEGYERDLRNLSLSRRTALLEDLNQAEIVLLGDFHTLRQSQRLLIRFLRDREIKKPKVLGLEVVAPKHEKLIQAWLQKPHHTKRELDLRSALDLEERWGSSFETYKEIFLLCHRLKIQINGLRFDDARLDSRDAAVADTIKDIHERTWILMGEFHCARPHLPKQILKRKPDAKILVIQQNNDRLTHKFLQQLSIEKTLILKQEGRGSQPAIYCVLHTPLWVKWQSYIERHLQSVDLDAETSERFDPYDQISWSLKTLREFLLDPRYPPQKVAESLLDFHVYGPDDPDFVRALSRLSEGERRVVMSQLRSSKVALVMSRHLIFLSELTVNSCSQSAGAYLYKLWSGMDPGPQEFFKNTLIEAIAFLLSKILNHSRKARHFSEWEKLARTKGMRKEAAAALRTRIFSERYSFARQWIRSLHPYRAQASSALGQILGDSAFEAFLAGEFSKARLSRILTTKIETELHAFEVLVELKSVGSAFVPRHQKRW